MTTYRVRLLGDRWITIAAEGYTVTKGGDLVFTGDQATMIARKTWVLITADDMVMTGLKGT